MMTKIRNIAITLMLMLSMITGYQVDIVNAKGDYVVDDADLFTTSEEMELKEYAQTLNSTYNIDTVVVTTNSTGYKSAQAYADDYYDYNGYASDGALLLIDMGSRNVHISTAGRCISAINDTTLDILLDKITPYLSNSNYYEGAYTFVSGMSGVMDSYDKYGSDVGYYASEKKFNTGYWVFAVVASVGTGVVIFLILNSKQGKIKHKTEANDYITNKRITHRIDQFIRRDVSKSRRASSSHSSTHTGSSGISHGGGGRGF